jgi:hypothetical protein
MSVCKYRRSGLIQYPSYPHSIYVYRNRALLQVRTNYVALVCGWRVLIWYMRFVIILNLTVYQHAMSKTCGALSLCPVWH